MLGEYNPVEYTAQISPTPLLLPARNDALAPAVFAIAAYEKALEPKRQRSCPAGTSTPTFKYFGASSRPALASFLEHLAS